jgi:hypothetical protein
MEFICSMALCEPFQVRVQIETNLAAVATLTGSRRPGRARAPQGSAICDRNSTQELSVTSCFEERLISVVDLIDNTLDRLIELLSFRFLS